MEKQTSTTEAQDKVKAKLEAAGKKYDELFKLHYETYGKSKEEAKQIALKESGLRTQQSGRVAV